MAQKFLVSIDLNKNELQNARLQNLATAPGTPVVGQVYFNTTDSVSYEWNGTAWIARDAAKVAAGSIPLAKLAVDPLARLNHTGTQAAGTITGLATVATSGLKVDVGLGNVDNTSNVTERAAVVTLTNKTLTGATNVVTASLLKTATTEVSVSAATAPTTGQVLMATSSSAATWQTPTAGTVTAVSGTAPIVSSGGATPAISITAASITVPGSMSAADKTKLDGVATGATANSTDAILLARANHTGTQLASTISNFDTQVRSSTLNQMAAPTTAVAMNAQKLTGLANGSAASDSAAFGQIQLAIDAAIVGLEWKKAVRAVSLANIVLASGLVNGSVIDSVTLATGDRVLVKDQTVGSENGIYIVPASGAASRSLDTNTSALIKDMSVMVAEGGSSGTQWKLVTDGIVLGTTALVYVQHGVGGTAYTAGNGLTIAGNDFNVGQGTGIVVSADAIAVDTAVVVRKFALTIGDATATSIAVTHNLGNQDAIVSVRQVVDNAQVICDVAFTSANVVTLGFTVAPTLNALRVSVQG